MHKDLDRRIVEHLQRDGRISLRELARRLDVSAATVGNRLNELEASGVIRGYKALVDYQKLGYPLTTVTLIKARGNQIPKIVEELKQGDDRLTHVYEITGEFDILVIGKFRDQESMNREIKRLLSHPAIERTNTSIVLSVAKEEAPVGVWD
ncbi:Lrp/AsnC family transcriptional regulator [Candidatus Acetothermia bacterium]|jgi:DNA-binding Lrp family transcriptional regulator|nr:Lrp/AsnC family transcriptional regulator [Candidatus Acetothermia bacterium]MCI2430981.1 Lrp/AsnC family transcriptional regulator [Candidatus Acetothermia bacterium]MCI2436350.1 Lrp/AsnC family transcriptional regulator [Candidatus Acetothermia bacterium]